MTTPSAPPANPCAKHPKVMTYLRCASCGIPICPDCLVQTPVGQKCRACGLQNHSPLFTLSPTQAVLAALAGLGLGVVAGIGLLLMGGMLFFGIFLALAYGRFAGSVILAAGGRKMGLPLEIVAGASLIVGGLLPIAAASGIFWLLLGGAARAVPAPGVLTLLASHVVTLILLVVVAAAAISRIRYAWSLWNF